MAVAGAAAAAAAAAVAAAEAAAVTGSELRIEILTSFPSSSSSLNPSP